MYVSLQHLIYGFEYRTRVGFIEVYYSSLSLRTVIVYEFSRRTVAYKYVNFEDQVMHPYPFIL